MAAPTYGSHVLAEATTSTAGANPTNIPEPAGLNAATDYQIVVFSGASGSNTFPQGTDPTGPGAAWSKVVDLVVTSNGSLSGSARVVVYESTTATGPFVMTIGGGGRVWGAVRARYPLPAGSTGRTIAPATLVEPVDTASTSHPLPAVATTAPDSLVIGIGASDQTNAVGTQNWPSTGTFTKRADTTQGNSVEVQSIALADLTVPAPTAGVTTTFTTATADEAGMVAIVLNGVSSGTAHARTITDTVGIADATSRTAPANRTITDAVGIADDAARTAAADRTVTDTVGIADDAAASLAQARTITDTVGIADAATRTAGAARSVTDTVGIADSQDVTLFTGELHTRTITDTVGIADSTARAATSARTITDTVGIADATSRVAPAVRSITDTVGIADSVTAEDVEPPGGESSTLTPGLFAVDWDTDELTPLPAWVRLALSPVRNDMGGISVDYPAGTPGFDTLAAGVTADPPRVLKVEIRLGGSAQGRRRGFLVQKQANAKLLPAGIVRFDGHFPEWLLSKALVAPQTKTTANPKGELLISGLSYGAMLQLVIDQAQDRPGVLPGVTVDFTATHDSNGVAWAHPITNLKIPPKTTVLAVADKGVELGAGEFVMTDDLVLRAFNPAGRGVDRSTGGTPLTFAHAINLAGHSQKESARDAGAAVLAAGGEGNYAWATNATALASLGFRAEVAVDGGNIDDAAGILAFAQGQAEVLGHGLAEYQSDVQLISTSLRPLINYDVGDWAVAVTGTTRRRLRIAQLAVEFTRTAPPRVTVSQNDLVSDALAALIRRLNRLNSGDAVIGTSSPTPDEVDTTVPNPPTGLVVSSEAFLEGVDYITAVTGGWTPPTLNTDGSPLADLDGYLLQFRYLNEPGVWTGVAVEDPADVTAVFTAEQNRDIVVRVAALDTSGHQSAWSAEVAHLTAKDDLAPPTPAAPVTSSRLLVGYATWNGLGSVGEAMPVDLLRVQVHLSASQVFTASAATRRTDATEGLPPGGGTFPLLNLPAGSVWWVALVAEDKAGNLSAQSPSVQLTISRAIADDIADQIITAAKLGVGAVTSPAIAPDAVRTPHLSVAAFSDNLLPNGAFEDADLTVATLPAEWSLGTVTGTLATLTRDTTAANVLSGSAAAKVALTAASGTAQLLSAVIPVSAGDVWYLEASARASRAVAAGLSVRVLLGSTPTPGTDTAVTAAQGLALGTTYAEVPAGGANLAIPALVGGNPPRWMRLVVLVGGVAGDAAALDVWVDELRARRVVGTAEIADAAISRAKIGLAAVGTLQVEYVDAGQINAGTLSAVITLSGEFRTAATGRRMVINGNGWEAWASDGTTLFAELDLATETMLVTGEIRTGLAGERVRLLQDGSSRYYGASGTDYASIENDGGVLRMRSRTDANGRRSYVDFNPVGMKVWYGSFSGTTPVERSKLDVGLTYGVLTAPVTGIRTWRQFSPTDGSQNRFHFVQAGSGGDDSASVIHYYGRRAGWTANTITDNTGVLRNAVHANGILMGGGSVAILGNRDDVYGPFTADGFSTPSSGLLKTEPTELVRHLPLGGRNVLRAAPSQAWYYRHDLEPWPDRPGVKVQKIAEDGTVALVDADWARPQPAARLHFGPVAEDLQRVSDHLVHRDDQGTLMVDLRDLVGVLWAAVTELDADLSARIARLEGDTPPDVVDGELA